MALGALRRAVERGVGGQLTLQEASGAMGDLGTYVPLALALATSRGLDLGTTLIGTGLYHAYTAFAFRIPMPVQPMKSIAAIAIAEDVTLDEALAAGVLTGGIVLVLGVSGLIGAIAARTPRSIIRGMQLGLGVSLAKKGLDLATHDPETNEVLPWLGTSGLLVGFAAAIFAIATVFPSQAQQLRRVQQQCGGQDQRGGQQAPQAPPTPKEVQAMEASQRAAAQPDEVQARDDAERSQQGATVAAPQQPPKQDACNGTTSETTVPAALILAVVGLILALASGKEATRALSFGPTEPQIHVPTKSEWGRGFVLAAVPQLPLTVLNSVVSVCELSQSLYGGVGRAAPPAHVAASVGLMNVAGCWFGVMPCCHGAGGLAAQHRFGARSGAAILFLGAIKVVLGLLFGSSLGPLLDEFPKPLLGVLLLVAGVELASTCAKVSNQRGTFVMLVTAAVTLHSKTAAGCAAGVACELVLCARDRARKWRVERREQRRGAARKDGADDEEGEGSLLALGL